MKNQNVRRLILSPFWAVLSAVAAGNASKSPHCRFHVTFEGFEWFLYNRTAAFDNIVSQMEARTPVPERRTQTFGADGPAFYIRHIFRSRSPAGGDRASCLFFSFTSTMPLSRVLQFMYRLHVSCALRSFCAVSHNGSEVSSLASTSRTYFLLVLRASMAGLCAATWLPPTFW